MKRASWFLVGAAAASLGGCGLVSSNGLNIGYTFDPQELKQTIGQDGAPTMTVPDPGDCRLVTPDPCAAAGAALPAGSATLSCDGSTGKCVATATVRRAQPIDLRNAMTPVPDEAVKLGVAAVTVDKVTYWWTPKTNLNVATPPVDIYVAAEAAKDETDPTAVKLGTLSSLPANSSTCTDPADTDDLAAQQGSAACKIPLTQAGQDALGNFVKNFRNAPFQVIIKATLSVTAGQPIPNGTLDIMVRPRVVLNILR